MFLNRFRRLLAGVLPTVVWWPSSPEGKAWNQRATFNALLYHTQYKVKGHISAHVKDGGFSDNWNVWVSEKNLCKADYFLYIAQQIT